MPWEHYLGFAQGCGKTHLHCWWDHSLDSRHGMSQRKQTEHQSAFAASVPQNEG